MRIDSFTKAALAAMVVLLALIALRPYLAPDVAHAQGPFTGMQFAATPVGYSFFDPRTGELWEYSGTGLVKKYRISKPGEPLVKEK
jgi:hypothetical protein